MHPVVSDLQSQQGTFSEWRHHLHSHPELAFEETGSAQYIADLLRSWGYAVTTGIGKTGVVASLTRGAGNKAVGLRADTDALPILEQTGLDYGSQNPGKMHACGHDGHMTMLLGAARHLAERGAFNGTVHLIFQPAEEIMGGAKAMIEDGLFERFPMDAVFGMHNMPGEPQGKLIFRAGPMMASVDGWEIVLEGKGSHGSTPHLSIDPVVAGSAIVMALQTIVSRNIAPLKSAVVSVGAFQAGDAGNVIPQSALLRLSIRASTPEVRELVLGKVRSIVAAQAESFGVTHTITGDITGAVLVNDPHQTEFAAGVARELLGPENVDTNGAFYMGSEDFAFMAQQRPATYCIIGNGDTAQVHHPKFDFNDRNLSIGAAYWVALAERFLA